MFELLVVAIQNFPPLFLALTPVSPSGVFPKMIHTKMMLDERFPYMRDLPVRPTLTQLSIVTTKSNHIPGEEEEGGLCAGGVTFAYGHCLSL